MADPDHRYVTFDGRAFYAAKIASDGDRPVTAELEYPLQLVPDRPIELIVLVEGTICEVYADKQNRHEHTPV